MRIEQGLDTGAICLAEGPPIWPDETAGELHDRLATLGAELMVKALGDLAKGSLACWPQHEAGVTYAAKIEPSETRIDWSRPRAGPRAPRDTCQWRRQARHAPRRQADHRLRQGRATPHASAARRQAPDG